MDGVEPDTQKRIFKAGGNRNDNYGSMQKIREQAHRMDYRKGLLRESFLLLCTSPWYPTRTACALYVPLQSPCYRNCAIQVVVGCLYGSIMAYFGGIVDEIMMRILEIITAIPSLLVTILIMIAMGNSAVSLLIALCIASWCQTARVVRGQIMQLRESEYVMAAEALGERPLKIIVRHLLPNIMGILILEVATAIPGYIFQEAGLSFIGLGLKAPSISLGLLISNGQAVMNSHVNQLIFPALVLCIMVLAFNLLGDGLRNALDPKFRK